MTIQEYDKLKILDTRTNKIRDCFYIGKEFGWAMVNGVRGIDINSGFDTVFIPIQNLDINCFKVIKELSKEEWMKL